MKDIRLLKTDDDFFSFANIATNAYTAIAPYTEDAILQLKELLKNKQENDDTVDFYGLFQHEQLIAGMRTHTYKMNLHQTMIQVGGVGQVAVDLLHKKEQAAKALLEYFLTLFRSKTISLVALYPFRPDFYKKMGFGYGSNIYQYSLQPSAFAKGPSKQHLIFASIADEEKIKSCYNRYVEKTHGMFYKTDFEWQTFFKQRELRIVAFEKDNEILGYIAFSFRKAHDTNFLLNDLVIKECIYETPEALLELSTFLNSQADQVHRIEWNTHDENIRFFTSDARNGATHLIPSVYHPSSTSGIGLMYRIINIEQFIQQLRQKTMAALPIVWQLNVVDSFLVENNIQLILQTKNGFLEIIDSKQIDVSLTIDIAELSSLFMGVISLKELYMYSKVQISDCAYLQMLNDLFVNFEKPICTTAF